MDMDEEETLLLPNEARALLVLNGVLYLVLGFTIAPILIAALPIICTLYILVPED